MNLEGYIHGCVLEIPHILALRFRVELACILSAALWVKVLLNGAWRDIGPMYKINLITIFYSLFSGE